MRKRPEGFALKTRLARTKPSGGFFAMLERLSRLEDIMVSEIAELKKLLK